LLAYAVTAYAEYSKIAAVIFIMSGERDPDSPVQYQGKADETKYGQGRYSLADNLYEYVYDQGGFVGRASLKSADPYQATSENQEDLEARALNLHGRNLQRWLKGDYSISRSSNPMGDIKIVIHETLNGNPTGRMTTVRFSLGRALISLVSVNKPVPEAVLLAPDKITREKAAEIAFADLLNQYSKVLQDKSLAETPWTAEKAANHQHLVWVITFYGSEAH